MINERFLIVKKRLVEKIQTEVGALLLNRHQNAPAFSISLSGLKQNYDFDFVTLSKSVDVSFKLSYVLFAKISSTRHFMNKSHRYICYDHRINPA